MQINRTPRTNFARQKYGLTPNQPLGQSPVPEGAAGDEVRTDRIASDAVFHGPAFDTGGPPADAGTAPEQTVPEQPPVLEVSPPPPRPSDDYAKVQQELAEVRLQLTAEREARMAAEEQRKAGEARLKADQDALAEYSQLKRTQELEQLINTQHTELSSIDPEDAKKLLKLVHEYNEISRKDMQARLDEQKQQLARQVQDTQAGLVQEQHNKFKDALTAAVPNIEQLVKSPEYRQFLKTPVSPGSKTTNEAMFQLELSQGNMGFVVSKMAEWAQAKPNPADIAQVSSAAAGFQAVPAVPETEDWRDLLHKVRSGQIDRKQFRELKRKANAVSAPAAVLGGN
jgi:hypothetical protein